MQFVVQRTATGVYTLTGEELPLDESRRLLGSPTPCVGRNVELGMLDTVLSTCFEEREPRMVLVTGVAGAGKSRLRHELMRRAAQRAEPPVVLFGRGEPLATSEPSAAGSSYRTLGQAVRRLCDIRDDDDADARRAKLAGRVGAHVPDDERPRVVQFVGELAGVPSPDDGHVQLRAARQDPVLMSDQLHLAMLDFLRAECAAHPVLVVLEDIHWADAASVKLVEGAVRALKGSPLAALLLARPEANQLFPALWTGGAHVMPLAPLARRAREQLVRHVLGASASGSVVARIVEQSEGNPLFLEELIRGAAAGRGEETPETVLAILQARIGRLDAGARRVLRAASVYGETARASGVAAVLGEPRASGELEGWLARLTAEEILEVRGTPRPDDDAAYRFRHALVRDAAYDTLGDAQRVEAHRLAAEYLEANRDAEPFVLAEHFRQGAAPERAVPYYLRAAEHAYDTADTDAMARSSDGGLRSGAQGPQRGELLSFQVAERFARERYPQVVALAGEAMPLLAPGERPWSRVLSCLIPSLAMTSQVQPVAELVERLEGVEPSADARAEFIRCVTWASVLFGIMGARRLSRAFLERTRHVASACEPTELESLAVMRACEGNDAHVVEELPWTGLMCQGQSRDAFRAVGNQRLAILMSAYYGKVLGDIGDRVAAEADLRENLAHAERLGEEFSLAYARVYLARLVANEGPVERLDEPAKLARAVIASGNTTLRPVAHAALAQILRRRGKLAEADAESQRAVEAVKPFPGYAWDVLALRARILAERGQREEALEVSEAGVRRMEDLGMEGHGELALRLALVEARDAAGRRDAAKEALARTVERLRKRMADFPGPADRARYVSAVAVNARIAALAREWGGIDLTA